MTTKHKGRKSKTACKTTAKVIGNHVTVKTTCPLKPKVVKAPCAKIKKGVHKKARIPTQCKGLTGRSLTECKHIMHKKYTL